MTRNETQAHHDMAAAANALAVERALWASVLARPANYQPRKPGRAAGLFARILGALFA